MIIIKSSTQIFILSLVILILIISTVVLVGCWDIENIEDLALVANIAFDVGEHKDYKMTVQILLPEALGNGGSGQSSSDTDPIYVISAEGQTAFEANRKLREYIPRRPFYGNSISVMIGEELAKKGILPVLNLLEKDHEFRRNKLLFIAIGEGGKVLEAKIQLTMNPGEIGLGFADVLPGISTTKTQIVGDFIAQAVSTTKEPIAPVIKLIEDDPKVGENPEIRVARTAAFKGDKLVGILDEKESRGFLWVLGEMDGIVNFQAPVTDEIITIELIRSLTDIKAKIDENGQLSIDINIRTEGNLADQTGFIDMANPQIRRSIEKRYAETIRQEIKHALNKAQKELKTDIFGFGGAFFRAYPKVWKSTLEPQWDDIYPFIPVNIYVKANVRRSNLTLDAPVIGGN